MSEFHYPLLGTIDSPADLRGLGAVRTLVLVDGRRYIPDEDTGVADLAVDTSENIIAGVAEGMKSTWAPLAIIIIAIETIVINVLLAVLIWQIWRLVRMLQREFKPIIQDTQETMTQIIKQKKLNRVVVAACSPRMHEPTFQTAVAETLATLFELGDQTPFRSRRELPGAGGVFEARRIVAEHPHHVIGIVLPIGGGMKYPPWGEDAGELVE